MESLLEKSIKNATVATIKEIGKISMALSKPLQFELKGVQTLTLKGDKGDDGYSPIKGKDYFTDAEIKTFLEKITPKKGVDYNDGKAGDDGYTPKKGKDYFTESDIAYILKQSTPKKGVDYFDGKPGESIKGDRGLIGPAPKHKWDGTKLAFENPDGSWGEFIDLIGADGLPGRMMSGGNNFNLGIKGQGVLISEWIKFIDFIGAGVTTQFIGNDTVVVTIAGGSSANISNNETPTGAVDDSNAIFTLAHTPKSDSLMLYVQGQLQIKDVDYTISGATITFGSAPIAGSIIRAFYTY